MGAVTWPELIGAISLACDVGMVMPLETGLGTAVVAVELGDRLGVDEATRQRIFDVSLLQHIGCTAPASEVAAIMGDEMLMREHIGALDFTSNAEMTRFMFGHVARANRPLRRPGALLRAFAGNKRFMATADGACEAGRMLGRCYGAAADTVHDLDFVYEAWSGHGIPAGVAGDAIPVAVQVVQTASLAVLVANAEDTNAAVEMVRRRRGRTLSPASADAFLCDPAAALATLSTGDLWDTMLSVAPRSDVVADDDLDEALAGIGDFVDLKAPCLVGHSRGVAELAANAAAELGAREDDVRTVRRAGWVHDIGRVAVSSAIWDQPDALTADQREKVRLHSYYTGRALDRLPGLADVAAVAVCHHERLDGSGYHAGTKAAGLTELARILAAADTFHAMTEARPYRAARDAAEAAKELDVEVAAGRIDRRAADAVKVAAGVRTRRRARATETDLTPREVEVLRLVARGLSIKQMGHALTVSAKTVDGHLQRIYPKIGVSTRTGATLYALQHGLLNGENSP